jgi:hypothetical protein
MAFSRDARRRIKEVYIGGKISLAQSIVIKYSDTDTDRPAFRDPNYYPERYNLWTSSGLTAAHFCHDKSRSFYSNPENGWPGTHLEHGAFHELFKRWRMPNYIGLHKSDNIQSVVGCMALHLEEANSKGYFYDVEDDPRFLDPYYFLDEKEALIVTLIALSWLDGLRMEEGKVVSYRNFKKSGRDSYQDQLTRREGEITSILEIIAESPTLFDYFRKAPDFESPEKVYEAVAMYSELRRSL